MKIIDQHTLDELSREACASARLRKNLNLHDDYNEPCQRMFNALEPGTYVRPHRHLHPPKPECFMAIRGKLALVVFADDGAIDQVFSFGPGCDVVTIDLPPGIWHTVVSLESGSIFFETHPGPYAPLSDKDFAPWAPLEGAPEVQGYLAGLVEKIHQHD